MKTKILTLMAPFMVASVALMGPARAAEQWIMLGEQQIKSVCRAMCARVDGDYAREAVAGTQLGFGFPNGEVGSVGGVRDEVNLFVVDPMGREVTSNS